MKTIEILKKTLSVYPLNKGYFKISININGRFYSTITNNYEAICAAFNKDYNFNNTSLFSYPNNEKAKEDLVFEILKNNKIDLC